MNKKLILGAAAVTAAVAMNNNVEAQAQVDSSQVAASSTSAQSSAQLAEQKAQAQVAVTQAQTAVKAAEEKAAKQEAVTSAQQQVQSAQQEVAAKTSQLENVTNKTRVTGPNTNPSAAHFTEANHQGVYQKEVESAKYDRKFYQTKNSPLTNEYHEQLSQDYTETDTKRLGDMIQSGEVISGYWTIDHGNDKKLAENDYEVEKTKVAKLETKLATQQTKTEAVKPTKNFAPVKTGNKVDTTNLSEETKVDLSYFAKDMYQAYANSAFEYNKTAQGFHKVETLKAPVEIKVTSNSVKFAKAIQARVQKEQLNKQLDIENAAHEEAPSVGMFKNLPTEDENAFKEYQTSDWRDSYYLNGKRYNDGARLNMDYVSSYRTGRKPGEMDENELRELVYNAVYDNLYNTNAANYNQTYTLNRVINREIGVEVANVNDEVVILIAKTSEVMTNPEFSKYGDRTTGNLPLYKQGNIEVAHKNANEQEIKRLEQELATAKSKLAELEKDLADKTKAYQADTSLSVNEAVTNLRNAEKRLNDLTAQLEVAKAEEKAKAEQLAKEAAEKAKAEQLAREAAEKAEAERLAKEAAERAEAERLAKEAAEKAEAERLAKEAEEKAKAEQLAREAAERAEAERLAKEAEEKAKAEQLAKEAAERAEAEKLAKEAAERAEAERLEKEAAEKAKAEQEVKPEASKGASLEQEAKPSIPLETSKGASLEQEAKPSIPLETSKGVSLEQEARPELILPTSEVAGLIQGAKPESALETSKGQALIQSEKPELKLPEKIAEVAKVTKVTPSKSKTKKQTANVLPKTSASNEANSSPLPAALASILVAAGLLTRRKENK